MGSKKKVQESGESNMRLEKIKIMLSDVLPHNYKTIYYVLY